MKKLLILSLLLFNTSVFAKTGAGTLISNQATLMFEQDAEAQIITSNIASFRVSELLDFTLIWTDASSVIANSPDTNRALTYRLTNTGNALQSYILEENPNIGGGEFNPIRNTVVIYVENGSQAGFQVSGVNTDNEYASGQTISLLPDQSVFIYTSYNIPSNLNNGDQGYSQLRVQSNKAGISSLTSPGQSISANGSNPEVVVGNSLGRVQALGNFEIAGVVINSTKEMINSEDLNGGNVIAVNSVLTYRIAIQIEGVGTAKSLRIVDILPSQLQYVPNSMTLNSVLLTDAIDGDFGNVTNNTVEVILGDQVAPNTFTLLFKARVR